VSEFRSEKAHFRFWHRWWCQPPEKFWGLFFLFLFQLLYLPLIFLLDNFPPDFINLFFCLSKK
jgi:hypothetical protein